MRVSGVICDRRRQYVVCTACSKSRHCHLQQSIFVHYCFSLL